MTTLITGVAGFLGSHLAKQLLSQGYSVIGIDDMSSGTMDNLKKVLESGNFHFFKGDVVNPDMLGRKEFTEVTEIYHLASPASPKFYQASPFKTIEVNTIGTRQMLELAKELNARIVFASTSEAYGDPQVHPQHESYHGNVNTWGPRACYDESKRLGEVYCYEYFHRYGVRVKVARIFNTYSAGLRNDDGRVISNFVSQSLRNENISVYGDGSQTRSFCYVDDTVNGLMLMMDRTEADGQIINIGNSKEYTILQVAQLIKALTGSSSTITFEELPEDDPKLRRPMIDKAIRLLGWTPKIDLEEGLIRTIQAYREKIERDREEWVG